MKHYLLAAMIFACGSFLTAMANESTFAVNGLKYTIQEGIEASCAGYENDNDVHFELILPESIDINGITYPVTSISSGAFAGNHELNYLELGKVAHIGKEAFKDCRNLSSVSIPETVNFIGDQCFLGTNLIFLSIGYDNFKGAAPFTDWVSVFGEQKIPYIAIPDFANIVGGVNLNYINLFPEIFSNRTIINILNEYGVNETVHLSSPLTKGQSFSWADYDWSLLAVQLSNFSSSDDGYKEFTAPLTIQFDFSNITEEEISAPTVTYNGIPVKMKDNRLNLTNGPVYKAPAHGNMEQFATLKISHSQTGNAAIENCESEIIAAYTMTGIKVGKFEDKAELKKLPAGVYIIVTGDRTQKIIVR